MYNVYIILVLTRKICGILSKKLQKLALTQIMRALEVSGVVKLINVANNLFNKNIME